MKLPTVFSVAAYIRLSRFGRDYIETGKYLERCFPDRDVRFISITDTATLNKEGIVCSSEYKKINSENYRNSHRTESTSYWTYSTIHRVLQNEMYVGNMVQGRKTQHMRGKQRATDKEDWIIVKGTHEAIIDEDTWNKAQDLLKRRTRNLNLNNNVTAFAGFIKCGDCGRSLVRKNNNYVLRDLCASRQAVLYSARCTAADFGKNHTSWGLFSKVIHNTLLF